MRVLLVSDPSTQHGFASLEVMAGSFLDPDMMIGSASYVQAMLPRASKKYPNMEKNDMFFKMNGGECNAFTSWTTTNFHMKVANQSYDEALDIFSNYFISPTFPVDF